MTSSAGLDDEFDLCLGQLAESLVGQGAGFFQNSEGADNVPAPDVIAPADGEIFDRALRLRAPKVVGWHLDIAEGIMFRPCAGHYNFPFKKPRAGNGFHRRGKSVRRMGFTA